MNFYGQKVDKVDGMWVTKIDKPIYGTCVAINEKILDMAAFFKVKLKIICPGAEEVVDPKEFKKQARRIEKVFRFPDDPMILYQKSIGLPQPEQREKQYFEEHQTRMNI